MIYGERIRFRAAEKADLPTFVKWINDPEVKAGISIYSPYSQAEGELWFEEMLKRPHEEHILVIEVCLPGEREASPADRPAQEGEEHWKAIGSIGLGQSP